MLYLEINSKYIKLYLEINSKYSLLNLEFCSKYTLLFFENISWIKKTLDGISMSQFNLFITQIHTVNTL